MRARYMTTLLASATLLIGLASPQVVSAAGTLDWQFWDFFNVPLREYFDMRSAAYGETPIGAECFSQEAITNGTCTPSDPSVPNLDSYPYTIWSYTNENNARRTLTAPFRFSATGTDMPGYTLTEPVFLPTFNSGESIGTYLDFYWSAEFVDHAVSDKLDAIPCTHPNPDEGYYMYSEIVLEMDLQQSRRTFGVVAADADAAQTWWDDNTNGSCTQGQPSMAPDNRVERDVWNWFFDMGGEQSSTRVGKYDIMNAYGWFIDQAMIDISTTVDQAPHEGHPVGTTHVTIHHMAWGTSNLLDHMFYWGATSYKDHHLDSTMAMGWQGMEPFAWYDDMIWSGTVNPTDIDFVLEGVMTYDFENISLPGPDGIYNNHSGDPDDDFSVWALRPHLSDNLNNYEGHGESELDRYPGVTDIETTPGSNLYGASRPRAFIPTTWDLFDGETLHFQFPTGNVVFYDPNLTPIGAAGQSNDFVEIIAPLTLHRTHPASYGTWDDVAKTWTVVGPTTTGGSVGSPGDYPDEAWGAIYLKAPEPGATIGLAAGSALLALLYRRRSRRSGGV